MRSLLAIRGMRLFYCADTLSAFGDYALWLAMGIWVKLLTGSTSAAGLVFFAFAFGSMCSPLTGVLADRVRRRPLLVVTQLVTGILVLALTFVHTARDIWLIYAVMFLYGVSGAITNAAQSAMVAQLVPEQALGSANGLQQLLRQTLRLVTPAAGVAILVWGGGAAVAIADAATFGVAALCLALLPLHEQMPEAAAERHWTADVSAGFRYLARTPVLRQLVAAMGLAMLVIGCFESVIYSVVTTGLGHSPNYVGVVVTLQGVGAVVGGLSAAALLNRTSDGILTVAALVLAGIGCAALAAHSVVIVLVGSAVFGAALPWAVTGALTALQRHTPLDMLGRVRGAADVAVTGPQTAGIAIGAGLVAALPYWVLCYAGAALLAVTALYLGTRGEQRRGYPTVRAEVPDTVIGN